MVIVRSGAVLRLECAIEIADLLPDSHDLGDECPQGMQHRWRQRLKRAVGVEHDHMTITGIDQREPETGVHAVAWIVASDGQGAAKGEAMKEVTLQNENAFRGRSIGGLFATPRST